MVDGRVDRVAPYRALLRAFVDGDIAAPVFERLFLAMFANEPLGMPEPAFHALDGLFADVDAFCADPELRAAVNGLDEAQLQASAAEALAALGRLQAES